MPQMWTVAHQVDWTPILTFGVRRLRLLEWFEANTEPVAFLDDEDRVGVSIFDRALRLTVTRSSLTMSCSTTALSIDDLQPAVEGVFEVLEPQDATVTRTDSLWTSELAGEYNEERAALTSMMTGSSGPIGDFRGVDTSALVDFHSLEHTAQAEFGIVERGELLDRLHQPHQGRLGTNRSTYGGPTHDRIPEVALLTDLTMHRTVGGTVHTAQDVPLVAAGDIDAAREIATVLAANFEERRGGREHSQAG